MLLIPSLEFGGAQRSMCKLSVELAKRHNVYITTFNNEIEPAFQIGGSLISLDVPAGQNVFQKAYFFIKRCLIARKYKKQLQIDTSISYMDGANYVNILSQRGEKVITSVRGSQLHDETIQGTIGMLRLRILIPLLYPLSDSIVALNSGIKQELINYSKVKENKITVIYNFYDIKKIYEKANEQVEPVLQNVFDKFQTLITAGRLAPEKGYTHLIKIYGRLKKVGINVKLIIVGDGILREHLTKVCKEYNLSYYAYWESKVLENPDYDIFFLGYKENPFKYISRATVFTLTSSSEGGPNILSEAMICGTPVVSVDCPSGPREKLANLPFINSRLTKTELSDYGILMPMLNASSNEQVIQEWVNTLTMFLGNSDLRKKYAERAKLKMNDFTSDKIFDQWEMIL